MLGHRRILLSPRRSPNQTVLHSKISAHNRQGTSPEPLHTLASMLLAPRYEGPCVLTMFGDPCDQIALVARQRRRFETTLATLNDEQWATASRCEGWSVQDVIAHLVGVNSFWELSVRSALQGEPTKLLAGFDPADTPPLMIAPMRALTHGEVLAQFVTTNDGFLNAIDGLDATQCSMLAEAPIGHVALRVMLAHALWDSWIHERDVMLPLHLTPTAEADEVKSCLEYCAAVGPALSYGTGSPIQPTNVAVESSNPECGFTLRIGTSVEVVDGIDDQVHVLRGDATALVESLSLRTPFPTDSNGAWSDVIAGLQRAFNAT